VLTEAWPRRKAGTDSSPAIVRSQLKEFRKVSARPSPEGPLREARNRSIGHSPQYSYLPPPAIPLSKFGKFSASGWSFIC